MTNDEAERHIRHSSFVIRHSSFAIRHSPFAIRHSSFVIRHSPLTAAVHGTTVTGVSFRAARRFRAGWPLPSRGVRNRSNTLMENPTPLRHIAFIGDYVPRRCGIAT